MGDPRGVRSRAFPFPRGKVKTLGAVRTRPRSRFSPPAAARGWNRARVALIKAARVAEKRRNTGRD